MSSRRITTLRDQRASRSPRHSKLQKPIYITQPKTLIPLLENADFERLPWYYQARTLEESYIGRETPFVWNYLQADSKQQRDQEEGRCACTVHCHPTPVVAKAKLRHKGKKVVFVVKLKDIPEPTRTTVRDSEPFTLKIRVPPASLRSTVAGREIAGGVGLFSSTTQRIRSVQRGGSFVWIIKPVRIID
ncbi:hypothetical protein RHS03_01993, partial [Rhizoctonia solani]